ncbi:MAG TPA: CsiV family protein [Gammaproteobacteria bacterium]|nr:CsiV family protein [Gammaproteobacteria bacterium]
MRTLTAIVPALLLVTASAQESNRTAPEPEPDPLYHVEVILFEWVNGNRAEEDFFHGVDTPLNAPSPTLLRLPRLELESLRDFDPRRGLDDREPPAVEAAPAAADAVPAAAGDATQPVAIGQPAGDGQAVETLQEPRDRLQLIEPWTDQDRDPAFAASADDAALPDGFRILRADELQLINASIRLDRNPYRLLGHVGWVQTGVDSNRAVPLDLARLGIVNLRGTIKVYRGTYLHAAVDLEFLDGRGTLWTSTPGFGPTPLEYAQRYRLESEHNAFRSGDLVAIDHPLFSVLVRVTQAPEAEDGTQAGNAGGPAG